jgi:glycolate oxidase FAD binding subunit
VGVTPAVERALGDALAAIVGVREVRTGGGVRAFAVDGRVPRWVVSPRSVEEVSRCLTLAHAEGLAVAPTGHGTRLGWGGAPSRLDVVLSLARLDRILAHEPADLTASVEAGVAIGRLNTALAPHRQCFPLDPARARGSTVGGLIATAASGPYRARYGTMRELLLGVTVVQADGTVTKGGGRVVKNVTGYDMPKLHVGALGTLGVVVRAHLRLHPVPPAEATRLFGFRSADAALDAGLQVLDAPLVPSRVQLLDGRALAGLGPRGPAGAALAVTLGSVPEAVRAQGARVEEACRRSGGDAIALPDPEGWWPGVSDATWPDEAASVALRIGSRATDVVKALRAVEAACDPSAPVRLTAEVANGVLHVLIGGAAALEAPTWLPHLRSGLAALGASAVVEHAPAEIKAALDVWGDVGPALGPMRALKAELDPRGVLNPGRFVGGI